MNTTPHLSLELCASLQERVCKWSPSSERGWKIWTSLFLKQPGNQLKLSSVRSALMTQDEYLSNISPAVSRNQTWFPLFGSPCILHRKEKIQCFIGHIYSEFSEKTTSRVFHWACHFSIPMWSKDVCWHKRAAAVFVSGSISSSMPVPSEFTQKTWLLGEWRMADGHSLYLWLLESLCSIIKLVYQV